MFLRVEFQREALESLAQFLQKAPASISYWKPTTKSSAHRTMITSPQVIQAYRKDTFFQTSTIRTRSWAQHIAIAQWQGPNGDPGCRSAFSSLLGKKNMSGIPTRSPMAILVLSNANTIARMRRTGLSALLIIAPRC